MIETQEQREARWAASRARQEAYRNHPDRITERVARIAAGKCVLNDALTWCITHDAHYDLGHDLDINGYTREDGTARDD